MSTAAKQSIVAFILTLCSACIIFIGYQLTANNYEAHEGNAYPIMRWALEMPLVTAAFLSSALSLVIFTLQLVIIFTARRNAVKLPLLWLSIPGLIPIFLFTQKIMTFLRIFNVHL